MRSEIYQVSLFPCIIPSQSLLNSGPFPNLWSHLHNQDIPNCSWLWLSHFLPVFPLMSGISFLVLNLVLCLFSAVPDLPVMPSTISLVNVRCTFLPNLLTESLAFILSCNLLHLKIEKVCSTLWIKTTRWASLKVCFGNIYLLIRLHYTPLN